MITIRHFCDVCKKPVKEVGKLIKVKFLSVCKGCRKKMENRLK